MNYIWLYYKINYEVNGGVLLCLFFRRLYYITTYFYFQYMFSFSYWCWSFALITPSSNYVMIRHKILSSESYPFTCGALVSYQISFHPWHLFLNYGRVYSICNFKYLLCDDPRYSHSTKIVYESSIECWTSNICCYFRLLL